MTFARNLSVRDLQRLISVGTLNTFIYSNIMENNVTILLAPVIAGLVYSTTIIDDMKTGIYRQLAFRIRPLKYIKSKIISSIIFGGGIFLISYILIFFVTFILDPSASVRTIYNRKALFGLIYDRSMLLYCFAFIGYSFIYGAVYSLVSLGVAMITRNKYMTIGLPFFICYSATYFTNLLPQNISDIFLYILPYNTFDITLFSPFYYLFQLGFTLVIGIIMIKIGSKTILENGTI